ncbi:hypothetical protein GCM10027028_30770 [Streptomyces sundarbansensis]
MSGRLHHSVSGRWSAGGASWAGGPDREAGQNGGEQGGSTKTHGMCLPGRGRGAAGCPRSGRSDRAATHTVAEEGGRIRARRPRSTSVLPVQVTGGGQTASRRPVLTVDAHHRRFLSSIAGWSAWLGGP